MSKLITPLTIFKNHLHKSHMYYIKLYLFFKFTLVLNFYNIDKDGLKMMHNNMLKCFKKMCNFLKGM